MSKLICWSCQQETVQCSHCSHCHLLQPLSPLNSFETLALAPGFELNLDTLEALYMEGMKNFHPDRFVHACRFERSLAAQYAAAINQAYGRLTNPVTRIADLLKILQAHSDTKGLNIEKETIQDEALLLQVMTFREDMMDAESDADRAAIKKAITAQLDTVYAVVNDHFNDHNERALKQDLNRVRYFAKLHAEL